MKSKSLPVLVCVLACGAADADYSSELTLSASGFFDSLAAGGMGIGSVYESDAGTIEGADFWRGMYAEATASAEDGELVLGLVGSVWTGETTSTNGAGQGTSTTRDTYTIGSGTSALGDGDPVQILVQVRLDGDIDLSGRPNSVTAMELDVAVPAAMLLDYSTGNLVPPLDLDIYEVWEFEVDTTVGATPWVNTDLRSWLLVSGFGPDEVGRNLANFDVLVRVMAAPGFEGVEIVSLAGAPIGPISTAGDFDGDGIADSLDNCIGAFNPPQQDTNGDNLGNACDPDIAAIAAASDCFVNFADLLRLKGAFISEPGDPTWDPDADFTSDSRVDFADLQVMKDYFFDAPGPSALANACTPVLLASGVFTLNTEMAFDLDTGTETAASDPTADVVWHVLSPPHNVFFAPLPGARIDDFFGSGEPDSSACRLAEPLPAPVPFAVIGIGTYLCARTNQGHIARFQISDADSTLLPTATTMSIAFAVWD